MKFLFLTLLFCLATVIFGQELPYSARSKKAIAGNTAALQQALTTKNLRLGDPIFMRIFKETNELEVWVKSTDSNEFKLFKIYEICYYSGDLGPKKKQGDKQSPEGFYFVKLYC